MPDRIERAATDVRNAAHELVGEVRKERRSRRIQFAALLLLLALGVGNNARINHQHDADLHNRLCAAWDNRVQDHALLTDYLSGFVGGSEKGQQFVNGLADAYAESDAQYAEDRGLTKAECK